MKALLAVALVAAACGDDAATAVKSDAAALGADAAAAIDAGLPEPDAPPPAGGMVFTDSCAPGDRIVVAAVGDVLLHGPLQSQAYARGHATLWREVAPLIVRAGAAYANLEGPSAAGLDRDFHEVPDPGPVFDDVVYTSFPQFNYHRSLIPALRAAGFDVVSTANNHALDRGPVGEERTLDALAAGALPASGTRRRSETEPQWWTATESGGFTLAWLACAFSTNLPDPSHQVLRCDDDGDELERLVSELAARPDIDAVLVTPHGGDEYATVPALRQKRLAARVLDAGALAVFGNHPHVVQPWEKHITPDGRETFVIYSIGNFVSGQTELARQASAVVYLGLVRRAGQTRISWVGYVPTYMQVEGEFTLWPADKAPVMGAEAAALVEGMLDPENALGSDAPLPTCR